MKNRSPVAQAIPLLTVLALLVVAAPASAITREAMESVDRAPTVREIANATQEEIVRCADSNGDDCRGAGTGWLDGFVRAFDPLRASLDRIANGGAGAEAESEQSEASRRADEAAAAWPAWIEARIAGLREFLGID